MYEIMKNIHEKKLMNVVKIWNEPSTDICE